MGAAAGDPQALLDALPDGALVADAEGQVIAANTAAHRLLDLDRLVGRPLAEVMQLQDLEGRTWWDCSAPYSGLAIRREVVEQAWYRGDGTEVLVAARLTRRTPRGPVELVGVSLGSARARDRLDRERSDLVATVAHELRSPLTGVKGFTAALLARWDKFDDDQKKLIMRSVHNDTDRVTRLISELLEVARIDTGRLSLHPRPVDVAAALSQVAASVRAGTYRDIVTEVADPSLTIQGDPDRFAQVVTNLVDNAIKHGDGVVHVTARVAGDDPEAIAVVVEDSGPGIPPEVRRRVFTKYWKSASRGGSGLGMYIVHGLVTASGGTVTIGDAAGGGASIEVRWPRVVDGPERAVPEPVRPAAAPFLD